MSSWPPRWGPRRGARTGFESALEKTSFPSDGFAVCDKFAICAAYTPLDLKVRDLFSRVGEARYPRLHRIPSWRVAEVARGHSERVSSAALIGGFGAGQPTESRGAGAVTEYRICIRFALIIGERHHRIELRVPCPRS